MKKCSTIKCVNIPKAGNYCGSCKSRRWREKNPEKYAYLALKNNAKRRGKLFDISFDEFNAFCIQVGYIKKRGITRTAYHIDRIDENKGYTIDNIQILQNHENVKKYFRYHYCEKDRKMIFNTETQRKEKIDTPF